MSEQLHVHRAADWFESELQPIPRAEWEAYVAEHVDLVPWLDDSVRWTDHPGDATVALEWEDGRIVAFNLDHPTRVRLARIATALHAVLQGDDCEVYGADGEPLVDEDAEAILEAKRTAQRDSDLDRIFDANRQTSRADFLRGFLRRE